MFKMAFHKIFSLMMAFLVLFSTVSFTVEKHFCGETLIDVAIFTTAATCGMDMTEMSASSEKKSCCKDELELVKGQDQLKISNFDDLHFDQQLFISAMVYSFRNLFEGLPKQIIPHKDYSPPNLVADIQVLDQVFII